MPTSPIKQRFVLHKSDLAAVLLAMLILPLLVIRTSEPNIVTLAKDQSIYSQKYFPNVRAPVQTAILDQQIKGQILSIPHVLFPGYSNKLNKSYVDAVAFTNLQSKMIHSQSFQGLRYKNPYISQKPLTQHLKSSNSSAKSDLKGSTSFFSGDTNCSSPIRIMQQSNTTMVVAGVTTALEIFLLNKKMQLILSSKNLSSQLTTLAEEHGAVVFQSVKVFSDTQAVYVTALAKTPKGALLVTHKIFAEGTVDFTSIVKIPIEKTVSGPSDPAIQYIQLGEVSAKTPFKDLREALESGSESATFWRSNDIIAFRNRHIIILTNATTGEHIAAFQTHPGVLLLVDEDNLVVQFLSQDKQDIYQHLGKFDIVAQQLTGDSVKDIETQFRYVVPVAMWSEMADVILDFNEDAVNPTDASTVNPIMMQMTAGYVQTIYLTPSGTLVAVNTGTGQKLWQFQIDDFISTSLNAYLTAGENNDLQIIILTMGDHIRVFNAQTGNLLGIMYTDETKHQDTSQFFYDEQAQKTNIQVIFDKFHPFGNKKAMFIIKQRSMDIIGFSEPNDPFSGYWERGALLVLSSIIVAVTLRVIMEVKVLKD